MTMPERIAVKITIGAILNAVVARIAPTRTGGPAGGAPGAPLGGVAGGQRGARHGDGHGLRRRRRGRRGAPGLSSLLPALLLLPLLLLVAARRHVGAHQVRISRLMTARAAMLITSVTANSTRPAAIRALTSTPEDSGKSSAMCAAIVDGFAELMRLKVTSPETDRTIATAIVSPSARTRPSIYALIIADFPNGRTVMRIISQRVAPRASAASC